MTVLSIGQCGYDDSRIAHAVREAINAGLEQASSAEDARRMIAAKQYQLVLVNRVFDSDGDSGVDFIAEMRAETQTPMMLISDYADAQQAAIAAGAAPGFGKSALHSPRTVDLIRHAAAVKK